jgi:hypothetical protein
LRRHYVLAVFLSLLCRSLLVLRSLLVAGMLLCIVALPVAALPVLLVLWLAMLSARIVLLHEKLLLFLFLSRAIAILALESCYFITHFLYSERKRENAFLGFFRPCRLRFKARIWLLKNCPATGLTLVSL